MGEATARFRAELTGAWAEFLASLFFVFFGAGSVCGAVKAVGEPVVVEPINYAASFGFAITFLVAHAVGDGGSGGGVASVQQGEQLVHPRDDDEGRRSRRRREQDDAREDGRARRARRPRGAASSLAHRSLRWQLETR